MHKINAPQKISFVFDKITGPIFQKNGFASSNIIANWKNIVGETIAAISWPHRVSFAPSKTTGGTLYVNVSNPGIALELQANENIIIQKIATFFGYKAIARIRVQVAKKAAPIEVVNDYIPMIEEISAADQKETKEIISNVKDKELKEQLARMADAFFVTKE